MMIAFTTPTVKYIICGYAMCIVLMQSTPTLATTTVASHTEPETDYFHLDESITMTTLDSVHPDEGDVMTITCMFDMKIPDNDPNTYVLFNDRTSIITSVGGAHSRSESVARGYVIRHDFTKLEPEGGELHVELQRTLCSIGEYRCGMKQLEKTTTTPASAGRFLNFTGSPKFELDIQHLRSTRVTWLGETIHFIGSYAGCYLTDEYQVKVFIESSLGLEYDYYVQEEYEVKTKCSRSAEYSGSVLIPPDIAGREFVTVILQNCYKQHTFVTRRLRLYDVMAIVGVTMAMSPPCVELTAGITKLRFTAYVAGVPGSKVLVNETTSIEFIPAHLVTNYTMGMVGHAIDWDFFPKKTYTVLSQEVSIEVPSQAVGSPLKVVYTLGIPDENMKISNYFNIYECRIPEYTRGIVISPCVELTAGVNTLEFTSYVLGVPSPMLFVYDEIIASIEFLPSRLVTNYTSGILRRFIEWDLKPNQILTEVKQQVVIEVPPEAVGSTLKVVYSLSIPNMTTSNHNQTFKCRIPDSNTVSNVIIKRNPDVVTGCALSCHQQQVVTLVSAIITCSLISSVFK